MTQQYTTNHPPLYYIASGFVLASMFFVFVYVLAPALGAR